MKNRTNKFFTSLLAVVILFALVATDGWGQNFTNTSGTATYSAGTNGYGAIRMRTAGTIGILPNDQDHPIPGIVDWSGTVAQIVQPYFYTNLYVSATNNVTVSDAVHVTGGGYATTTPICYTDLTEDVGYFASSGTRHYEGTFYYSGTVSQKIFAESGAGSEYVNIDLSNSTDKYNDAAVVATGLLNVHTGADLDVGANFTIGIGTSSIDGNVNVNTGEFTTTNDGILNLAAAADFTVNAGGTLTLNSTGAFTANGEVALVNDATAQLNMGNGSRLNVPGSFTNAFDDRTNMSFNTGSTVSYQATTGTQYIVSTAETNPYGNLEAIGGATKEPTTTTNDLTDDIYLASTLLVSDASIEIPDGDFLQMGIETATFPTGNLIGVQGAMRREGSFALSTDYTMNYYDTKLAFATAPTGWLEMNVLPNTAPANYNGEPTQVINRRTRLTVENIGSPSLSAIQIGYDPATEASGITGNINRLLLFEGYDSGQPGQMIYDGTNGTTFNIADAWVRQEGTFPIIQSGTNELSNIASTSDIFPGYQGVFSVADGRWSDPETWVNNWIPSYLDDVEIRHVVYTGHYLSGTNPYGGRDWQYNEEDINTDNPTTPDLIRNLGAGVWQLAKSVSITNDKDGTGSVYGDNRALVIGNDDVLSGTTLAFGRTTGTGIQGLFNDNATDGSAWAESWTVKGSLQGIYLFPLTTCNVAIRASKLDNVGTVINNGVIEIGD